MDYKVNEIRPYARGRYVYRGKIVDVDHEKKTYTIEDLETKEAYVISEEFVFIGDD